MGLTVVDHDGDRAGISDIDEELLQCSLAQGTGIVSTGDDDSKIGTCLGGFLAELNGQLGRTGTAEQQSSAYVALSEIRNVNSRSSHNRDVVEACLIQSLSGGLDQCDSLFVG